MSHYEAMIAKLFGADGPEDAIVEPIEEDTDDE